MNTKRRSRNYSNEWTLVGLEKRNYQDISNLCLAVDQAEYEELAKAHKEYQTKSGDLDSEVQELRKETAAVGLACQLVLNISHSCAGRSDQASSG